jgi:plastocyanin
MLTRHYVIGRENGLADTFVYIKAGLGRVNERQTSVPVLDNVQCQFQPYVLGVRAGQPFEMRNSDSLLHNVHGTPRAPGNREFNLAMPLRGMSLTRVLPTPEVFVRIKCDVHPWMFAYLGVVEHPWFAVTDRDGRFTLPNGLPVGRYTIAAVHVKAGEVTQEISVTEGGAAPLEFVLDVPQALTRVSP